MKNQKQAFAEAIDLMPGGVNSPVRAFKSVNMDPIVMETGQGAIIKDIDGNEYIDYVLIMGTTYFRTYTSRCSKSYSTSC